MSYTTATIEELVKNGNKVHLVHWDHKKKSNYELLITKEVSIYKRSELSIKSLYNLINKINPDIIVVSAWQDKVYLLNCFLQKSKAVIVSGLDNKWRGSIKQRILSSLSFLGFFKLFFDYFWVPGYQQFVFANKLGYRSSEIIFDLYSCNSNKYKAIFNSILSSKRLNYPYRFIYVGRYTPEKGLESLLKAWKQLGQRRKNWELHIYGNGDFDFKKFNLDGLFINGFLNDFDKLKILSHTGCFILPSIKEAWGVVVHEFAYAGFPLILSNEVGSASHFLIENFNGFKFETGNINELVNSMIKIINMSDEELINMGLNSNFLASRISSETSARNLMSIYKL